MNVYLLIWRTKTDDEPGAHNTLSSDVFFLYTKTISLINRGSLCSMADMLITIKWLFLPVAEGILTIICSNAMTHTKLR